MNLARIRLGHLPTPLKPMENRAGYGDAAYTRSGNVLPDKLHGATVSRRPGGAGMAAEMQALADALRAQGRFKAGENVVFIHTGGAVGLSGYPEAFSLPAEAG